MVDNKDMNLAADPDQIVKESEAASRRLRKEIKGNPEKARAFLLEIGILEKHEDSPHGVRLARRFR